MELKKECVERDIEEKEKKEVLSDA